MNQFKQERLNKSPVKSSYYLDEPKEYNVSFIPQRNGTYRIEVDSGIESVSQFSTAISALGMAKEDDMVEIHLQCPGGNVDASGAFLHAIYKCQAPVHVVASGGTHSAATHILLAADSFELADNFNSLIHNGSAGAYGNLNEYHSKSDFDKEFLRKQYADIYEGFLTTEEFDGVMRGDQIWLNAQQWCDRVLSRVEYFKQKDADMVAQRETEQPPTKPKKKKPIAK